MPKQLTVAEQAIVAKASQDLYRYEKTCSEHSAVLRRDLEAFRKAYEEYSANSNPMGFMPSRDEFDRYIEDSEKVLKKDCRSVLDHLHVVHAGYFLSRLLMRKVSEHGEHVYLEFMRRKVELVKQYPYVFPQSPAATQCIHEYPHVFSQSSATIHTVSSEPPETHPATLPARAFKSKEIMNLPRVSLQETELIQYQQRPELLQTETFVYFNEDEEDYEAFRIPAFITANQETIFYVVFADKGPTGMGFTSVHLFDLLRTSERVTVDSEIRHTPSVEGLGYALSQVCL